MSGQTKVVSTAVVVLILMQSHGSLGADLMVNGGFETVVVPYDRQDTVENDRTLDAARRLW